MTDLGQAPGTLDETTRPRSPKRDSGGRAAGGTGEHLVLIHDHLRQEMRQILDAIEQVAAGRLDPADLRSMVSRLTMRQNLWSLGAFCSSYCRILTVHHTIEDQRMFPALRREQESLEPVLERLEQEHEVIAGVLTRLDVALVEMVRDPAGLDRVREEAVRLRDMLFSHLAYEEEELVEPLSRLEIAI